MQDALVDEAGSLGEVVSQARTVLLPEVPSCLEETALELVCIQGARIVPRPPLLAWILLALPPEEMSQVAGQSQKSARNRLCTGRGGPWAGAV